MAPLRLQTSLCFRILLFLLLLVSRRHRPAVPGSHPPARFLPHRECRRTRRPRRFRNGILRLSNSSAQHGSAPRLCRVLRVPRAAQHRSQYHSSADLLEFGRVHLGRCRCYPRYRLAGRAVHPSGKTPNQFLSGGFFWLTEGNSNYNALQIDVTRRFSKGLQFRANYTWSKNLDINSGLTGAQANNQAQMVLDRNDLRRDRGPSALNTRVSPVSPHDMNCRSGTAGTG